jgi:hypothetical protein
MATCTLCNGTGRCDMCDGKGTNRWSDDGKVQHYDHCKGKGRCSVCKGTGSR